MSEETAAQSFSRPLSPCSAHGASPWWVLTPTHEHGLQRTTWTTPSFTPVTFLNTEICIEVLAETHAGVRNNTEIPCSFCSVFPKGSIGQNYHTGSQLGYRDRDNSATLFRLQAGWCVCLTLYHPITRAALCLHHRSPERGQFSTVRIPHVALSHPKPT